MKHKPECASNRVCAVYHNDGICPDPKKCDCLPHSLPTGREHTLTKDCWCNPKVEDYSLSDERNTKCPFGHTEKKLSCNEECNMKCSTKDCNGLAQVHGICKDCCNCCDPELNETEKKIHTCSARCLSNCTL